jgi:carbon storage regulator
MLVLSRQLEESIVIGDEIVVKVVDIRGDKVRLGIVAPERIPVHRLEVQEAILRQRGGADAVSGARPAKPTRIDRAG